MNIEFATDHDDDAELPVYARLDLEIDVGCGTRVRSTDGRDFLDLYGGHATALLGQAHPRLLDALTRQAGQLFFQTNLVDLEIRRRAARALVDFAPAGLERVFFVNSGAEANENALRLAFRLTGRHKAVALVNGFHGRTAAAAAVTWGARDKWYGFPRSPFDVVFVDPDDGAALEAAVDDDTACVILEPIQGLAGARDLDLEFLRTARRVTLDRGAMFIADEVQCGMGRSGEPFAISRAGVVPDLMTTAKGLAGGFPAGALFCTLDISERIATGDLGTTFGGGPMAAALIATVLDVIREDDLLAQAGRFEVMVRDRCITGPVTAVQGAGCLLGLRTKGPARDVLAGLRERGVLAGGSSDPHIMRLMPALIAGEAEVLALSDALREIGS
ncbi:MAG: aspartate aminotransferase family protein [Planctomycetes bacterium]|nr:aspartate aminotransferase family protein [Planctomycetota bacterium]